MTAGMAEVIAAHVPTTASNTFNAPESGSGRYCRCGHFVRVVHSAMDDSRSTDSYLDELLAAHVAEELAEAGYGSRREAKAEGLAEAAAIVHARIRDREQPFIILADGMSVSSGEGPTWAIPNLQLVERVIRARLAALVGRETGS